MHYYVDGDLPYWYIAGVDSYGAVDCGGGFPGVATKIVGDGILEFIAENIYEWNQVENFNFTRKITTQLQ